MKRCPECRRDYYDDTLLYCLDDGSALLEGPASMDEPATAMLPEFGVLPSNGPPSGQQADAPVGGADRSVVPATRDATEPERSRDESTKKQSFSGRGIKMLAVFVAAALILTGGFYGYRYFTAVNSKQIESIAIMPFVNGSGNPNIEYLSDGMTETIIKNLSQLANLRVRPRSSVFRYKGREADSLAVGRELQVQALLNGRVVQRGDDLSLYVELIDIGSDKVLWSEQYTRGRSDLVSLEHDVARDVTNKLSLKLSGTEEKRLLKTYTSNPEAYQLYLRGRHEWNKFSLDGLTKSISFFERAIEIDQNYALAYSGIADSHINLGVDFRSPMEHMPKARAAAVQAIALDDSLAEAHSSLASYKLFFEWDAVAAEQEFRRAIALDQNSATARHFYSHCLQFSGREPEALHEMRTAVELEPLSAVNNAELAWAYYLAGKHDESIEQSRKTLELEPDFAYAYFVLGLTYNAKGMYGEARDSIEKGLALGPDWPELQGLLAYTHAMSGDERQARETLRKALDAADGGYINEVIVASIYAALADNDQAMDWLERGYQGRCSWMKWIWLEPMLNRLRPDPRFKDLVRRIGT